MQVGPETDNSQNGYLLGAPAQVPQERFLRLQAHSTRSVMKCSNAAK